MSAKYLVTNDEDYLWSAFVFPLAGLLFDFFDGKVARWRNESSMIGQELDSLADLVRSRFRILHVKLRLTTFLPLCLPAPCSSSSIFLVACVYGPRGLGRACICIDLVWRRTRAARLCRRLPDVPRHGRAYGFHLLWARPPRSLQRDGRTGPQGCQGQGGIL